MKSLEKPAKTKTSVIRKAIKDTLAKQMLKEAKELELEQKRIAKANRVQAKLLKQEEKQKRIQAKEAKKQEKLLAKEHKAIVKTLPKESRLADKLITIASEVDTVAKQNINDTMNLLIKHHASEIGSLMNIKNNNVLNISTGSVGKLTDIAKDIATCGWTITKAIPVTSRKSNKINSWDLVIKPK